MVVAYLNIDNLKFGMTYEEYELLLKSQNNCCDICGKSPKKNGKMLAVDHCHRSKKNRALLCSSCNILIGFIEKNQIPFDKITDYLEKHCVVLVDQ